jgi:ankyrin repeat protein
MIESKEEPNTPATALRNASYHGDIVEVRRLLLEGVDPNVADEYGRTALSLAAGKGHIAVVDALVARDAWVDPHEDYDTYETPLMAAAANGYLEVVKKLVGAGANPSFHVGVAQRTAESYARTNGHADIVEYLSGLSGE